MSKESIRSILAEGLGDALKPRFRDQMETPEPAEDAPMALNDNRALKSVILDAIADQPTEAEQAKTATAKQNKTALREQILDALDLNNQNGN